VGQDGNPRPTVNRRFEWIAVIAGAIALLCLVWLAAKVTIGETMLFDEKLRAAIHSWASPGLTRFFRLVTLFGSQAAVIGVAVCAALVLFLKGRRDRAWLILIVMAGAELLEFILKAQFQRQRPVPLFGTMLPASYSFPSGHALLSTCCYSTLAALAAAQLQGPLRWLVLIATAALVLLVGISRVYLGVHYPSDAIAGYLVATVWLAVVAILYRWIMTL
jgi:undecaprenyl-diphosphatase